VLGISRDSPYSHKRWAEELGLTFELLSDWNGEAVRAFGVAQSLDGLDETPVRSCFLVEAGGTVRGAWSYGDDDEPDVGELLAQAGRLIGRAQA